MFLTPCPRCTRRVSRHSSTCPACGSQLAPTGSRKDPVEKLSPGGRIALRVAQVLAVVIIPVLLLAAAPQSGESPGLVLMIGCGLTLGSLLTAALLIGWFRETRRFVPFLAVGFSILTLAGYGRRSESTRPENPVPGVATSLRGDAPLPTSGGARRKPSGRAGKVAWVANRMMEDVRGFEWEAAARHGVKMNRPPASFLTPRYVAGAGSHPAVMDYWRRLDACLEELQRTRDGVAAARLEARAREAGLSRGEIDAMVRGSRERMDRMNRASRRHLVLAREVASAAQALHRHLVSVDERVHLEGGQALFESGAEMKRAGLLGERLRAAHEALDRHERKTFLPARNALRVRLWETEFP